jgi:hypothetical protein
MVSPLAKKLFMVDGVTGQAHLCFTFVEQLWGVFGTRCMRCGNSTSHREACAHSRSCKPACGLLGFIA